MDEASEPVAEAFLELCFEANFEAAVFFLSPSARLAWRAALEAETGMVGAVCEKFVRGAVGRHLGNVRYVEQKVGQPPYRYLEDNHRSCENSEESKKKSLCARTLGKHVPENRL